MLGRTLPANSLLDVRRLLGEANPVFNAPDSVTKADWSGGFGAGGEIDGAAFEPVFDSFYLTNAVCRASVTMAQCAAAFTEAADKKTGTHG